jgi:hypothetical protein
VSAAQPHQRQRPERRSVLDLDGLELAAGVPLGVDVGGGGLPVVGGLSARAALEVEVLGALARPPCVVSFSGGRDSSAMLALAVRLARREGLPEPVALTWRFPGVRSTDESDWQEMVVAYLGVREWERLSFGEELEVLGEVATGVLRAHGLLWPANIHLHVPGLDRARGGSLVTGWDGDGVLDGWPFGRVQAVLHGRTRPQARDALRLGLAFAPAPLRRRVHGPADAIAQLFPWLRRGAMAETVLRYVSPPAPRRWDRWVAWYARQRYLRLAVVSLDVLAAERDAVVSHPLAARPFLGALAREGGAAGVGTTRTEAMRFLFADVLPEEILARTRKAQFGRAYWGRRSRAFATEWDGAGIDPQRIDPVRLRAAWLEDDPPFGSSSVLQTAWLHSQGRDA